MSFPAKAAQYQVGIDLGTTRTAAAICRSDGTSELVPLGERSAAVPSAVFVGVDGVFVIGEAAQRRALSEPSRVVQEFKRRIGDPTPLVVGGEPVSAEALAARFVARVLQHIEEREGGAAGRVAVTHPAAWGPHKLESLRNALYDQGLDDTVLLSEPQAAAIAYARTERLEVGSAVVVYDLGGGTFDTAVVRKSDDGAQNGSRNGGPTHGDFELLGRPEGIERLGGVDFDDMVFDHVRAELGVAWNELDPSDPDVLAAVATLRQECTEAKEALSHDTEATIPVVLPGLHTRVRLERSTFEEMIRPSVAATVTALDRAIDSAELGRDEMPAVLLVGGSSRIPLVATLVEDSIGRAVVLDADPKGVIATGAALAARWADLKPAAADPLPEEATEQSGPDLGLAASPYGAVPADTQRPDAQPPVGAQPVGAPLVGAVPSGAPAVQSAAVPESVPSHEVTPFREPAKPKATSRPAVAIGIALAILAAIALASGLLSTVYRTGSLGPDAEASTPTTVQVR